MEIDICDTINGQVNSELWSSYLYLSMSTNAEAKGLKGFARWFYIQALEELADARIFINHMNSTHRKVFLYPIENVPNYWETVADIFDRALEHEKKITILLKGMANIADEQKDRETSNLLLWFIDKQTERIDNIKDILSKIIDCKGSQYALGLVDEELGQRIYKEPNILK